MQLKFNLAHVSGNYSADGWRRRTNCLQTLSNKHRSKGYLHVPTISRMAPHIIYLLRHVWPRKGERKPAKKPKNATKSCNFIRAHSRVKSRHHGGAVWARLRWMGSNTGRKSHRGQADQVGFKPSSASNFCHFWALGPTHFVRMMILS